MILYITASIYFLHLANFYNLSPIFPIPTV